MEKFGVDSVPDLVRLAEKAGIEPAQISDMQTTNTTLMTKWIK
jgi:hypothetical protein